MAKSNCLIHFKTEVEFCEHTTKILLGLLVGSGRKTICIPETPKGYFSNDQVDMLLLDVKNQEYLMVEYKLSGLKQLQKQIGSQGCIGIINIDGAKVPGYGIFGYTGKDAEIGRLDRAGVNNRHNWISIYYGFGMVYYWAYRHNKDDFKGGITGGNRTGFAAVYRQAIRNLHKHYGKLDFMLTHAALQSGYGVATSKKHYRDAIKEQPNGKE